MQACPCSLLPVVRHTLSSLTSDKTCTEQGEWKVQLESSCDTLFMCIVTTFKEGVRAGGGISDVLRKPGNNVSCKDVKRALLSCRCLVSLMEWWNAACNNMNCVHMCMACM